MHITRVLRLLSPQMKAGGRSGKNIDQFYTHHKPCIWSITSQYLFPLLSASSAVVLSFPSFGGGGGDGDNVFPLDQTEIMVLSDDVTTPPAPTPSPVSVPPVTPTGDLEPVGIIPLATSRNGEASDLYALKVRFAGDDTSLLCG